MQRATTSLRRCNPLRTWGMLWVIVASTLAEPGQDHLAAVKPPCQQERVLTGRAYWDMEIELGVEGVMDTGGERTGRIRGHPESCFRLPLRDVLDPRSRVDGYRDAIAVFRKYLGAGDPKQFAPPEKEPPAELRVYFAYYNWQRIVSIIGRNDFPTVEAFQDWYQENLDYFVWSEERKLLVVDEEAKRQRKPRFEYDVKDLSAAAYWYYEAIGRTRKTYEEDGFLRGWYSIPAPPENPSYRFRIAKSALGDRKAKEMGLRRALEYHVEVLERWTREKELSPEEAESWDYTFRSLAGVPYKDRESLLRWWNANKDKLVLSEDGERLVVSR